ncbi:uncharacterized protein [Watersipora subatra]|uniref:uncharacterized protein n=1 Tax=Watersipora subatra TaxID=2589382 RepID=UPI00355BCB08
MELLFRHLIILIALWARAKAEYMYPTYVGKEEPTSFEHFPSFGLPIRMALTCSDVGLIHVNYLQFSQISNDTDEVECSWSGLSMGCCEGLWRCSINTDEALTHCPELNYVNFTFQCIPAERTHSISSFSRYKRTRIPLYLSTPGFHSTYPASFHCRCVIFLTKSGIVLELLYADVDNSSICYYDYNPTEMGVEKKRCGKWTVPSIKNFSRAIIFDFRTGASVPRKGAWVRIYSDTGAHEVGLICKRIHLTTTSTAELPTSTSTAELPTSTSTAELTTETWHYTGYDRYDHYHDSTSLLEQSDIAGLIGGICGALLIIALIIYLYHRRHVLAQRSIQQRRDALNEGVVNNTVEGTSSITLQTVPKHERTRDVYDPPSYEEAIRSDQTIFHTHL